MSELENYFISRAEQLYANDIYITDGFILLIKDCLHNPLLKHYVNKVEELNNAVNTIPYEKGEEIDITPASTECELLPNNKIGIKFDDNTDVDYEFIKLIEGHFAWEYPCYTITEADYRGRGKRKLVKFWGADNKFLGVVLGVDRVGKQL